MSKKNWSNILSVLARTALAFVFAFGQNAWARQNQAGKDKGDAAQKAAQQRTDQPSSAATKAKPQGGEAQGETSEGATAQEKANGDGKSEGIKVHGHWIIEVRDPNGSVVARQEFENSLITSSTCCGGSGLLASVLGRASTVGPWEVALSGNNPVCPSGTCWIAESTICNTSGAFFTAIGQSAANTSCNLGVSMAQIQAANGQPSLAMVLSGSMTASTSGDFTFVNTYNQTGPGTTPLINLAGYGPVTGAFLPTTVSVAAGQTVQVTVQISFS